MHRLREIIQNGVAVKIRHGVTPRVDVLRPDDAGIFPALLEHTLYNRATPAELQSWLHTATSSSFRTRADGYDSVEWASASPDGTLKTTGAKRETVGGVYR